MSALYEWRMREGRSQQELGYLLGGLTRSCISHWETRGIVPRLKVAEVSKLTGIKPERLNPWFKGRAA